MNTVRSGLAPRGAQWKQGIRRMREAGIVDIAEDEGLNDVMQVLLDGFPTITWRGESMDGYLVISTEDAESGLVEDCD